MNWQTAGDYDDVTFLHFSGPYQNETNMETSLDPWKKQDT